MMEVKEIMRHIDHTLLKPVSTWEGIQALCEEAIEFGAASVCVPPCYIRRIHDTYGNRLKICTVVGFPLGYSTTEAKLAETRQALADGVDEVDMVINIAEVKNGHFAFVTDEIRALRQAVGSKVLKVIIETCYLTEDEKSPCARRSPTRRPTILKPQPALARRGQPWRTYGCSSSISERTSKLRLLAACAPARIWRPFWKRAATGLAPARRLPC